MEDKMNKKTLRGLMVIMAFLLTVLSACAAIPGSEPGQITASGVVEAVESAEDYPFLMAVQWHPEELVDHPEHRKIFEEFIARCREVAARRA